MAGTGLTITTGKEMAQIQASCDHQSGLIYVVPAERSWVCAIDYLPAHAVAGFFRELVALRHPRVQELMREWGIYYRELPRDAGQEQPPGDSSSA
ncbi:MAG: hypothetical protein AAB528_00140 [Chloroflexota bacterium]